MHTPLTTQPSWVAFVSAEGAMRGHRSSTTTAYFLLLLLAACSTVPSQHVEGYTRAFDEASAAGNRLYDGISAKVTREQAKADEHAESRIAAAETATSDGAIIEPAAGPGDSPVCARSVDPLEPYPACFNPTHFTPGHLPGEPDSLIARRRALATITVFNTIALRLASGETANALGAEVQRLGSNASSLATLSSAGAVAAPVIGITTDMAARLAQWAETLRADQELRSALYAGSPLIQQLLTALINDTPTMYALKREEVAAQADALTLQAREAEFDIEDIIKTHAAPQAPFVAEIAQRDQRYNNARQRLGLGFESLAALAGQGSQPFGRQTLDQIDAKVVRVESIADQYQEQIETLNRYYEALGEYVAMLGRVDEALVSVTASARAPQAITISSASLAQQATEIRDQALEIQKLLKT
jgi:hypothetical protein